MKYNKQSALYKQQGYRTIRTAITRDGLTDKQILAAMRVGNVPWVIDRLQQIARQHQIAGSNRNADIAVGLLIRLKLLSDEVSRVA